MPCEQSQLESNYLTPAAVKAKVYEQFGSDDESNIETQEAPESPAANLLALEVPNITDSDIQEHVSPLFTPQTLEDVSQFYHLVVVQHFPEFIVNFYSPLRLNLLSPRQRFQRQ